MMSRKQRFKKNILLIIFWIGVLISFCFFASLIILKANGYQLNWKTWNLVKTGMIILDGQPKDVQIKINQKHEMSFPQSVPNISPGTYYITVTKPQYQTWQKTYEVSSGLVIENKNILLFLEKPQEIQVPLNITIAKIISDFQSASSDIKINKNEIYLKNQLVTRFTNPIITAEIYPDNSHIIFQQSNEIRIMDIDGSNNILLLNLSSAEPSAFSFTNNGKTLYYIDGGIIYGKVIR